MVSPFFEKYGWKKPSLPPYLLTYAGGMLAGLCEVGSVRPTNTATKAAINPESDEGKKVFLATYTVGLLRTGLPPDKLKSGAARMATALGLAKGGVAISAGSTWLGRSLPPAGGERDALVAALDGYVTIA